MCVLFVLKRKLDYLTTAHVPYGSPGMSTGLYNSANFVNTVLTESGIDSKMVIVVDANSIDKEVYRYKPTHVIIEALWVTPAKFAELSQLHPNVKWIVRLHSELPFLANEGMAMEWIGDYGAQKNLIIGVNSEKMISDIRKYIYYAYSYDNKTLKDKVVYLPNCYPNKFENKKYSPSDVINIGCFGAIRPMKNHLIQAIAAVKFAEFIGKKLRFHINSGRIEMKGSPVLHNLEGMFGHLHDRGHRLISHEWVEHDRFREICASMDIGMQVSLNETFNIVAADHLVQGVPVVCSDEIPWASVAFSSPTTDSNKIFEKLLLTHIFPKINVKLNKYLLRDYIKKSEHIWTNYFGKKK